MRYAAVASTSTTTNQQRHNSCPRSHAYGAIMLLFPFKQIEISRLEKNIENVVGWLVSYLSLIDIFSIYTHQTHIDYINKIYVWLVFFSGNVMRCIFTIELIYFGMLISFKWFFIVCRWWIWIEQYAVS